MSVTRDPKFPDVWDVERYQARHSYVWEYGESLLELLDAKPSERILDLGCGAGHLTARIAESGAIPIGIDRDPAMIAQARINFPHIPFQLAEAAGFRIDEPVDAIFSNAVLHWVTEPVPAVAAIAAALKPGGRLVAEFGGKGNVDAVLDAVRACIPQAESPWYFPSIGEYSGILERQGLTVTLAQLFERPTRLEGEDGMRDWLQMFGGKLFESIPPLRRPEVLGKVESLLRETLWREGVWTVDYRRLRIVAIKSD